MKVDAILPSMLMLELLLLLLELLDDAIDWIGANDAIDWIGANDACFDSDSYAEAPVAAGVPGVPGVAGVAGLDGVAGVVLLTLVYRKY